MLKIYHSKSFEKVHYRYFATYKAGSEVAVATIFNFYRFYGNKTGSISVIVKTMKKLDKWNATLTLIDQLRKSIVILKIFLKNF